MNQLSYLLSLPVIQWAILLLSASTLVRTLIYLVQTLTSLPSSTLRRSLNQSLKNFLKSLDSSLIIALPSLSEALKTILMKKGLLNSLSQKSLKDPEMNKDPDAASESLTTNVNKSSDDDLLTLILNLANKIKGASDEKH